MYRARALALLAAVLAVLAVAASGRNDEEYFRGQSNAIAIVVATHNNSRYITSALESVEESVELFIRERKEKGLSGVSVQIIILDDNSSDDTALKVHRFVKHRKLVVAAESRAVGQGLFKSFSYHVPYPASSYFGNEVKYLVVELHTTSQRVGQGTLFNLGVDYAVGEMLFFMDGGVVYHKEHVRECYNALLGSTNAYARTGFSFSKAEEEAFAKGAQFVERPAGSGKSFTRQELLAEQAAESVLRPSNLCVWRKVHTFIEGFPESSVWDDDIVELGNAYIASLGVGFPWSPVVPATVEAIASNAPVASGLASAKALVRDRLIASHTTHLNSKLAIYHKGGVPETMDPRWRINSVALKSVGLEFVHLHKFDTRSSRLRSMLGLGHIYFASGDAVGTAAAYNVSRELVYPAKRAGNGGVVRTSSLGNWPISQHITIVQDPYRVTP